MAVDEDALLGDTQRGDHPVRHIPVEEQIWIFGLYRHRTKANQNSHERLDATHGWLAHCLITIINTYVRTHFFFLDRFPTTYYHPLFFIFWIHIYIYIFLLLVVVIEFEDKKKNWGLSSSDDSNRNYHKLIERGVCEL